MLEVMMKRIFRKNEEKYVRVHKVFAKVMGAFLLFYGMKTIIYFIALRHH
ncbi:hypothetical protein bcere0017_9550 [Bacillus cereus Rock1-3]|nr:hypothetical protein bcere0017_9550 [Bacillus cereus Rock1-3]